VKWIRESQWSLLSECRTYRIGKALVNGEPRYTLAKVTGREPELVAAGTLAECKAAASDA
jgi:hypothetical protein